MRRILAGRLGILIIAALLVLGQSGCTPSQYTKGVKVDRDYPDDVIPIYDDSVVFDYQNDDNEFSVSAGTQDDVEDVMDFYKEYFADEGILLTAEEEDDDEYSAEGVFGGFEFEISVGEPSGKWEEKLFSAVLEISLAETDEPAPTPTPEPTPEPTPAPEVNAADLLGLWYEQDLNIDGQTVVFDYSYYFFYDDNTGYSMVTSDTGSEYYDFTWELTPETLNISWQDGTEAAWGYALSPDSLVVTFSDNGSVNIITFSRDEPPVVTDNEFTGTGAWVVVEGDYAWKMAISIWPNGTGWFWWVDSEDADQDLDMTWSYSNGVLDIYAASDGSYWYSYNVSVGYDTLALSDSTSVMNFVRAVGEHLKGKYYLSSYVSPAGEVVQDASMGIMFNDDGTGSSFALDANKVESNAIPINWYLAGDGTLIIEENGELNVFYYQVQNEWLSLCMLDEYGYETNNMWFTYIGE